MARKQRVIYNKTENLFWKATHTPRMIEEGYCDFVKNPDKASKYSMNEGCSEAIKDILNHLAIGFPSDQFEVHTYEVIPKQFKRVE